MLIEDNDKEERDKKERERKSKRKRERNMKKSERSKGFSIISSLISYTTDIQYSTCYFTWYLYNIDNI